MTQKVSGYSYHRRNTKGLIKVDPYKREGRPKAKKIHYGKPMTIKAIPRLDKYNQFRGYKWQSFKRSRE